MKRMYKLLFIVLLLFVVTACKSVDDELQVIVNEKSTEFYVGETEVDFKSFFTIKGKDGQLITIEDSMIDATNVNFNQEGTYKVKLTYNGLEKEIEIKITKRNIVTYSIMVNDTISTDIKLCNSDFDFKQYFSIKDSNENTIEVLESYIDKSTVDFTKEGTYVIKLTYQDVTKEVSIKIVKDEPTITYNITIVENLPTTIEVGTENIDYKSYFKIEDSQGNNIVVLETMINATNVDVSKAGKFMIILNFNDLVHKLEFNVIAKEETKTNSSDLFISEYAEGKEYNKYIEIFNGTGKTIDLTNYSVLLFNYSKEPAQYNLGLSGTLKDGEIFSLYNPSAVAVIKTNGNMAHQVTEFNGNDVIALYKNDILIDIIGSMTNPVSNGWDVGEVKEATKNHTLIRKSNVYDPSDTFIQDEWTVLANEDFSNIKMHTMDNYVPKESEVVDPVDPPKERIKDIFISEYFEGVGDYKDSKYIEIYNGLGLDVNLENYSLALYKSGSTVPSFTQPLTGTLKDKEVFIVYAPYSLDEIKTKGHLSSEVCYFNGNGAIALLKNDEVIDVIGVIGEYPTNGWIVDDSSTTADNTIIRKETIDSPTDKWDASEWYACYDNYLFDIGQHNLWNADIVYDNFDQVINMIKNLELDSKGTATSEYSIKIKGTIFMDVKNETTLVYITDGKNFVKLHGEKIHNFTSPGAVYEVIVYFKSFLYQPTFEVANPTLDIKALANETPITEFEYKEVTLAEILALKKEDFALNITNGYLQSLLKINGYLQYDTHNSTRFDYCLTLEETYSKNVTGYINNGLYFKNDIDTLEDDLIDYEVSIGEANVQIDIYGVLYDWNPNRKNWRIYVSEDITIYNLNN